MEEKGGKGHGLGPPFLRVFRALIDWLLGEDVGKANKEALEGIKKEFAEKDKQLLMVVRACRLRRAYDPEFHKLAFAIRERPDIRLAILSSLEQLGGEVKSGRAPPSGLERKLQEILEAWAQ